MEKIALIFKKMYENIKYFVLIIYSKIILHFYNNQTVLRLQAFLKMLKTNPPKYYKTKEMASLYIIHYIKYIKLSKLYKNLKNKGELL